MEENSINVSRDHVPQPYVPRANTGYQSDIGWFQRFRRSNRLIVVVNFFSMVTGIMVVSVLQPILPDLLDVMYRNNYLPSMDQNPTPASLDPPLFSLPIADLHDAPVTAGVRTTTSTYGTTASNATFPNKPFIIGSLLGFAPLIEIFFTPVAVIFIKYLGFKKPMIAACLLQLFGCYAIAYADVLILLYAARITQAISVIFATVAGFSMIAVRFTDDGERSNALAMAMNGFPIGILIAYPCGTAIYSYFGVAMPFIIISGLSVFGTILVLLLKETSEDANCRDDTQGASYSSILSNKPVLLSLVFILYAFGVVFVLGATTPNRMATRLHAKSWEIGLVLFTSTLAQVITSLVVGKLGGRVNRWTVTLIGNLLCVIGLVAYPFCTNIYYTIGPETAVRIGWGFVTTSMGPLLGILVDQGHGMAYIRVYALFMSFNLFGAFAGSLLGGWLDGMIGFDYLYFGCAGLTLIFALFCHMLTCCLKNETEQFENSLLQVSSPQIGECSPLLSSAESSYRGRTFSTSYKMGVA